MINIIFNDLIKHHIHVFYIPVSVICCSGIAPTNVATKGPRQDILCTISMSNKTAYIRYYIRY